MERVQKYFLSTPNGVSFELGYRYIKAFGSKGQNSIRLPKNISIKVLPNTLKLIKDDRSKFTNSQLGVAKSLLKKLIIGVHHEYYLRLFFEGLGYRAFILDKKLKLQLGFAHFIFLKIPVGLTILVDNLVNVTISGIDIYSVTNFAAQIRSFRKPEPYKGKGILYEYETVPRKLGKTRRNK